MKLIRVTYRATFQQPKQGPINRMGAKISCPIFIEVYQATKDRWLARSPKIDRWPADPWPIQSGASRANAPERRGAVRNATDALGNVGQPRYENGLSQAFAARRG